MASHLTFEERQCLYRLNKAQVPKAEIGRLMGRDRSTIYREIHRNTGGCWLPIEASPTPGGNSSVGVSPATEVGGPGGPSICPRENRKTLVAGPDRWSRTARLSSQPQTLVVAANHL